LRGPRTAHCGSYTASQPIFSCPLPSPQASQTRCPQGSNNVGFPWIPGYCTFLYLDVTCQIGINSFRIITMLLGSNLRPLPCRSSLKTRTQSTMPCDRRLSPRRKKNRPVEVSCRSKSAVNRAAPLGAA
jgi:hypothetical protein